MNDQGPSNLGKAAVKQINTPMGSGVSKGGLKKKNKHKRDSALQFKSSVKKLFKRVVEESNEQASFAKTTCIIATELVESTLIDMATTGRGLCLTDRKKTYGKSEAIATIRMHSSPATYKLLCRELKNHLAKADSKNK